MKKKIFLATAVAILSINSHVLAKSISLSDLQSSQANYVPAVNVTSKDFTSDHWAYKSLGNITKKYGLLVGETGDKLDGSKPLSRNEAAVILVNLIGKVEQDRASLDDSEKTQIGILKNELSEEITALTGRVATLEKSVGKLQGSVSNIEKSNSKTFKYGFGEDFKIGGAFQFKYAGNIKKGADDYTPNFSMPYSEVRISGKMAPHIGYVASLLPNRTWGGEVPSSGANKNIAPYGSILGDAWISTDIVPHHNIIVGQSRLPIGVEGTLATSAINTIDRSQIARKFSNCKDIGIKVAGNYPMVDYYVGAFNGSGENYKDYNDSMGVGGWVTTKPLYKLPQYGKLELGGGYYRNKNGNTTVSTNASRYKSQILGAALGYKYKKVGLKSEWAYKEGYGSFKKVGRGMFVETTYDLTPKIQLLAKYDVFDPNKLAKRDLSTEYTIGTNYYFAGNNIKLQIDAVSVNNQTGKDSKRLMVLTQYVF